MVHRTEKQAQPDISDKVKIENTFSLLERNQTIEKKLTYK